MKLPSKRVKITFNHTEDVLEKLDAILHQLGLNSRNETIGVIIDKVYNELFQVDGEERDTVVNIVTKYKKQIAVLRKKSFAIMNDLNTGKIGYNEATEELNKIEKIISFTRNMSRIDGDVNNILFSAREVVKAQIAKENLEVSKDRNDIIASQANHRANIDMIRLADEIED